jgi:Concanavalin A-like lectin/glucanases superfamily
MPRLHWKMACLCVSLLLLTSPLVWADITSNLAGYWKFNESSGTAADSSGNGNAGTLTGATYTTPGKLGGGVLFGGDGDFVTFGQPAALNITGTVITLACWVRIDGAGGGTATGLQTLIAKDDTSGMQWRLLLGDSRDNVLFQAQDSSISVNTTNFTPFTLGTWHHIAVVYNGSTVTFYVDGVSRATPAATTSITTHASNVILGKAGGVNYYLNGALDEVRIYNRALSGADVTELMNFTDASGADITTGLLVWLEFSAGSGTTADDSATGNGAQPATLAASPRTPVWVASGCRPGGCLSFDGVDDYVRQTTGNSPTVTTAVTVTMWVNLNTTVGGDVVSDGSDGYVMRVQSTGIPIFFIQSPSGTWGSVQHNAALATDTWIHLTGTYDSSNIRLYIDAVQSPNSPVAYTGTIAALGGNPAPYLVGVNRDLSQFPFKGQIDNVRIYNRALTLADIQADRALGLAAIANRRRALIY